MTITPPTDGITVLSVYAFHAEHDDPYVNGSKVLDGNITSHTGVLRGESDSAENTQATLFLPEGRQRILRYAKDLDIDTGYKNQGEFLLRYQVVF